MPTKVLTDNGIIEVLQEAGAFNNCKCIFHWFTGSVSERKLAIYNGAYFSINPKMLKTKAGKDVIRIIPVDRIYEDKLEAI